MGYFEVAKLRENERKGEISQTKKKKDEKHDRPVNKHKQQQDHLLCPQLG